MARPKVRLVIRLEILNIKKKWKKPIKANITSKRTQKR